MDVFGNFDPSGLYLRTNMLLGRSVYLGAYVVLQR